MRRTEYKKPISFSLSSEVVRLLNELKSYTGESRTAIVEDAIEKYHKNYLRKQGVKP